MAGDGRASESALIARRRNDEYAASERLAERFFQRLLPFGGRLCKGEAQVDDSCAGVDTFNLFSSVARLQNAKNVDCMRVAS